MDKNIYRTQAICFGVLALCSVGILGISIAFLQYALFRWIALFLGILAIVSIVLSTRVSLLFLRKLREGK